MRTVLLLLLAACGSSLDDRAAFVAQALSRAEEVTLRTRPTLVAGKFTRMAGDAFSFYRGNLPLFRADWEAGLTSRSGFVGRTPPVWGLADPHPENFGILIASDGTAALEPNDFDSADRVPYLFDLRRLLGGLGVGVRLASPAASVQAVGEAAARAYAERIHELAGGVPGERITSSVTSVGTSAILADLFTRSARDLAARAELGALTVLDGSGRRLIRGVIDPSEPTQVLAELPDFARVRAAEALARLGPDPRWTVLDAAREYGSGVSSWPRIRLKVLVRGPTDAPGDDEILEIKEQTESTLAGWYRPAVAAEDTPSRVETAIRRLWARPDADPLWFTTTWLELPVQVRTESEAFKNMRVARWTGARASEAELVMVARVLGALLARLHSRSGDEVLGAIDRQLFRDVDAFVAEQGAFTVAHAQQVLDDHQHFKAAVEALGPTLGIVPDPRDLPVGPFQALLGTP